jgi:beta-lactam-binding protein with PASTA domain
MATRIPAAVIAIGLLFSATACGGTAAKPAPDEAPNVASIPDTVGDSLEDAEEQLESSGVGVREHNLDGEPIVVEWLWTVCRQEPSTGAPVQSVDLYVSHDCGWPGGDE